MFRLIKTVHLASTRSYLLRNAHYTSQNCVATPYISMYLEFPAKNTVHAYTQTANRTRAQARSKGNSDHVRYAKTTTG